MSAIRRRVWVVWWTALAVLCGAVADVAGASGRLPGEYGTVWVTNRTLNNVTAFDAGTGAVVGTVGVGSAPIGVVGPLFKGKVYSSDEGSNQVSVISRATRSRLGAIPVGPKPHHMMASTLGDRVYVAEYGSEILVALDDRTAYVSVRKEHKVKEVDLTVPRLTGREANVGIEPDTLQLTPDQTTLVVALRGIPAKVSLVKTHTPQLEVTTVLVPGTTTGHQWLSRSGRYTFVATEGAGSEAGVAVIDNTTAQLVTHYPYPGGGRPHGVCYDPLPPFFGS